MLSGAADRRNLQRIHLDTPLPGRIRGEAVHVIDVSLHGVRIAHQSAIGLVGDPVTIVIDWEGTSIQAECELRRSELQRVGRASFSHTLYHSALTFIQTDEGSRLALRGLIEQHVLRAIDEQKRR